MKIFKILFLIALIATQNSIVSAHVADELPKTWEIAINNSIIRTTLHRDGRLTSETIFGCFNCQGYGMCQVCMGTGGQYWYGIGMQPCGACYGSGRCRACGGKGYTIQNSTTQYGITVVYDERGNMYVMGGSGGSSSSGHNCKERDKVEVIEYLPTFGVSANENVYCPKCRKTTKRHVHELK